MGFELPASDYQQHHTVVGEESDREEHQGSEDPSGFLEGIREAEDAGADDGDEHVGEGLGLGGEMMGFAQKWRVFSWQGVSRRACFFVENHGDQAISMERDWKCGW